MRWRVAWLAAALSCASLSAQTTRPVTFVWDVILGEPGVSAEIERNGTPASCPTLGEPGPLERSCTLTVPVGPASFRARMANEEGEWGPWGDLATLTIPPAAPGDPPGPFTLRWHRFQEPTEHMAASVLQSAGNLDGAGTATSLAATFGSNVSAGSTLLAFVNVYNASPGVSSVTDTQGNTWAQVASASLTSAGDPNFRIETWRAVGAVAGATTVTAAFPAGMYCGMAVVEVGGAGAVHAGNAARVTMGPPVISGAGITPTVDGLHLAAYGYENNGTTSSPSTGWAQTIEVDESNSAGAMLVEERAAVNGVAQTPSWNHSVSGAAMIVHVVVENAATGGAGGARRRRLIAA